MRRQIATLVTAGLIIQVLLATFVLLYVNLPQDFNVPYGLNLSSVPLFRALWPYPVLSISAGAFHRLAAADIVALWVVYLAAAFIVSRNHNDNDKRQQAVLIFIIACLWNVELALFLPPVLSLDIYHYALFGRMVALHHLNPYTVPCGVLTDDPFWPLTLRSSLTMPYGPTWTLLSAALAALASRSVVGTLLVFKGAAALFNIAGAGIVLALSRRFRGSHGVLALLLYAWNPLILIESAGSGHNDVFMVCIALLGVLLICNRRLLTGFSVLLVSAMVKYTTILLALFCAVHYLARQISWRRAVGLATRLGVVSALLMVVLYSPFFSLDHPHRLLIGLTPSLNRMKNPVPFLISALLSRLFARVGDPSWAAAMAETGTVALLNLGFAVVLIILGRKVVQAHTPWPDLFTYFGIASLLYVYVVYANSFPWQLLAPLTAAILGPSTRGNLRLLVCCIGLGVGFMLGYA